jgi:hypothetical protein
LYEYENESLTLRKQKLRVFKNNVLKRIFAPKKEKVQETGKNDITKSSTIYSSSNNIRIIKLRKMRWTGHLASTENKK